MLSWIKAISRCISMHIYELPPVKMHAGNEYSTIPPSSASIRSKLNEQIRLYDRAVSQQQLPTYYLAPSPLLLHVLFSSPPPASFLSSFIPLSIFIFPPSFSSFFPFFPLFPSTLPPSSLLFALFLLPPPFFHFPPFLVFSLPCLATCSAHMLVTLFSCAFLHSLLVSFFLCFCFIFVYLFNVIVCLEWM